MTQAIAQLGKAVLPPAIRSSFQKGLAKKTLATTSTRLLLAGTAAIMATNEMVKAVSPPPPPNPSSQDSSQDKLTPTLPPAPFIKLLKTPLGKTVAETGRESVIWAVTGATVMPALQPLTNAMWVASAKPHAPFSEIARETIERGPFLHAKEVGKAALPQFAGMLGIAILTDHSCKLATGSDLNGMPGAVSGAVYESLTTFKVQAVNIVKSFNAGHPAHPITYKFRQDAFVGHIIRNTLSMLVLGHGKKIANNLIVLPLFNRLGFATQTEQQQPTFAIGLASTLTAALFGASASSPPQQYFAAAIRNPTLTGLEILCHPNTHLFSGKAAAVRVARTTPVLAFAISLFELINTIVPTVPE